MNSQGARKGEMHDHSPTGGPLMSLPKWYYTDPKVLEREKDKIFAKCWQYAGHLGQLTEVGSFSRSSSWTTV